MSMNRESFSFYQSFRNATKTLPKDNQKNALVMMVEYWIDWIEPNPEIDGIAYAIYLMAKPQIDRNNKRFANGSEWGRPKKDWDNSEKPKPKQTITKPKANTNTNTNTNTNINISKYINKENLEKRKFLDFVYLSNQEYNKLLEDYWDRTVKMFIDRLNGYIGQIGEKVAHKKYVSHNHTIRNRINKDWIKSFKDKPKPVQEEVKPQKEMTAEDRIKAKEMLDRAHRMFLSK